MIMRLTDIGSQYVGAFVNSKREYFDGGKTYKMTLPPNIPAAKFWSLTLYDNQTRSMLQTPAALSAGGQPELLVARRCSERRWIHDRVFRADQTLRGEGRQLDPDGSGHVEERL